MPAKQHSHCWLSPCCVPFSEQQRTESGTDFTLTVTVWFEFQRRWVILLSPVCFLVWRVCFLCVFCMCSGLNWNTFPLYALPGLWDYVSCVHYASLHSQQHTTGKTEAKKYDVWFLLCPSCAAETFFSKTWFIYCSSQNDNFLKCYTSVLKKKNASVSVQPSPSIFIQTVMLW